MVATDPVTTNAVTAWLWDTFGENVASMGSSAIKKSWKKFNWSRAENEYRRKILSHLSTMRLLGNSTPIDIGSIYTDVQVLDKLTAMRRFNIASPEDLKGRSIDFDHFLGSSTRWSALDIVRGHKRTYILGKPGAGKTTFLKHLAILACQGDIKATPIYISLKEWSDSKSDLLPFICEQFQICGFPDAKIIVEHILGTGNALVLLDGLDEVNNSEQERRRMLQTITNFTKQYSESRFCITCRIAANEYTFDQFTYIEIADFNEEQQETFIKKWYSLEPKKLTLFQTHWNKRDNEPIHDLARTPLLLTLICLGFDESLQFPKRRVDLYVEAVDALLKKWDSSRAIVRGDTYKQLEPVRKKQLLSFIAYNTFLKEEYLIRKSVLADEIRQFVSNLPYWDKQTEIDADQVLKAIESHHGLLVERAQNIYSFSHLTIQEYFAAQYISDNVASGTIDILIDSLIKDIRWREVMLMCSSLQSNASQLLRKFAEKTWRIVRDDASIVKLLSAVQSSKSSYNLPSRRGKANYFSNIITQGTLGRSLEHTLEISGTLALIPHEFRASAIHRARQLVQELTNWQGAALSRSQISKLELYLWMTLLLVECLQISSVDDRREIEDLPLKIMK